jgi:hypothetical protein
VDVVVHVRVLASIEGEVGSIWSTSSSLSFRGVSFSPASSSRWTSHISSSVHPPLTSMVKLNLVADRYVIVVVMSEHQLILVQERSGGAGVAHEGARYQDRCVHAVIAWGAPYLRRGNCTEVRPAVWLVGRERFRKGTFCILPSKSPVYPKSLVYISVIYADETLKSQIIATSTLSEGKPNPQISIPWTLSPPPVPKSPALKPTSRYYLSQTHWMMPPLTSHWTGLVPYKQEVDTVGDWKSVFSSLAFEGQWRWRWICGSNLVLISNCREIVIWKRLAHFLSRGWSLWGLLRSTRWMPPV